VSAARQGRRAIPASALGLALACGLGSPRASAQVFAPFERPGEERPELPEPAPPRRPEFTLPPLPAPSADELRLSQRPSIVVREFRVTGSTVFSEAELAQVTAPYTGRPLGAEELEELRQKLTLLYVNAGYLNSGSCPTRTSSRA
jgi:hemolysin activation/secretion protein